jgi:hypothetical protein
MRTCGGCTLCCTLVPVKELAKGSFTACRHQRSVIHRDGPGCAIYANRPPGCRHWQCVWLNSPTVPDDMRPDRVGFVVDQTPDLVEANGKEMVAVQVWVAPGHEEDWREDGPARKYIEALLTAAPVVLWRQADQQARAFMARNGGIIYGDPRGYVSESHLGNEQERWRKVQQLMGKLPQ